MKYLLLLAVLMVVNCSKSDSDSSETTSSESLELNTKEALDFTESALNSSVTGDTANTLAGSLEISLADTQSTKYTLCTTTTGAWDTDTGAKMLSSHDKWAGREIYCKIAGPAASPESIRGAFLIAKGIICAGQSLATSGKFEFTETEQTVSGDVIVSSDCFGDYASEASDISEGTNVGTVVFKYKSLTDNDKGWKNQITYYIESEGESSAETFYLNTTGQLISFGSNSWSVSVDTVNDTFSYEMQDKTYDRHVRIMVKGEVNNSTGAMSNISSIEGIYSGEYNIGTVKGNGTTGFKSYSYSASSSSAYSSLSYSNFTQQSTACTTGGTCSDDGIPFDNSSYFDDFVYFTDTYDSTLGLRAFKPVQFESVDWSALE